MLIILYILGFLGFLFSLGYFVNKHAGTSIGTFVEEKLGAFPHFVMYAVLEWVVIFLIYVDGFLSFVSNELSGLSKLRIPCLLCTRIDHTLVHRSPIFYYNESVCEDHKKVISSLAYCNAHKKLSDIRTMCQGCLLPFAAEKDCNSEKYKSIVGILHKDVGFFRKDDQKFRVKSFKRGEKEVVSNEESGILRCCCCGEPMKLRSSSKYKRSLSISALAPSPRAVLFLRKNEEGGDISFPNVGYTEPKSDGESELPEDEDVSNVDNHGGVDAKGVAEPLLPGSDVKNEDASKTPSFRSRSKFFGIPLSDSAQMSPRWANMHAIKPTADKLDFVTESNNAAKADGEILADLKRQVTLNRKSLISLYMELDEERSASEVAANNMMAMITRLQAEKAAIQMEALQYQRMREEQAEYDREALHEMRDMLLKRGDDMKALESKIEMYREKYGHIKDVGSEICEIDADEDYQDLRSQTMSMLSEKSDFGSAGGADQYENEHTAVEYQGGNPNESSLDFEGERSRLLSLLRDFYQNANAPSNGEPSSSILIKVKPEDESKASAEDQNRGSLTRELSVIKERLKIIEADNGFIKHASMTLQRDSDGAKLLTEIAQHLRELRQPKYLPSEITDACQPSLLQDIVS